MEKPSLTHTPFTSACMLFLLSLQITTCSANLFLDSDFESFSVGDHGYNGSWYYAENPVGGTFTVVKHSPWTNALTLFSIPEKRICQNFSSLVGGAKYDISFDYGYNPPLVSLLLPSYMGLTLALND